MRLLSTFAASITLSLLMFFFATRAEAASLADFGVHISVPQNIGGEFLPDFTTQINDFINTGKQIEENIKNDAARLGIPISGIDIGQWLGSIKDFLISRYRYVTDMVLKIVPGLKF